MNDTCWSWTLVDANTITMGPIPDDPEMDEDLEDWLDQIGTSLTLAAAVPGKRIAIDATTLLDAWVAGGFAEKLPHQQYRMTLKGQEVDAPPRIPIIIHGAGMTAPWTTEGVDSPYPQT